MSKTIVVRLKFSDESTGLDLLYTIIPARTQTKVTEISPPETDLSGNIIRGPEIITEEIIIEPERRRPKFIIAEELARKDIPTGEFQTITVIDGHTLEVPTFIKSDDWYASVMVDQTTDTTSLQPYMIKSPFGGETWE